MSLEMCHLLFIYVDVYLKKKILENLLRFETDVVLNILPCSADFTCVDGRTYDAGSVTRISFKYKLMGFRMNFFKNDFSVHHFEFVHLQQ